jgi:hypothetical protein
MERDVWAEGRDTWWERRREGERTHSYLSRVLSDLGAHTLALNAEQFHYDDFLCPDAIDDGFNTHRLCDDLLKWAHSHYDEDIALSVRAMAVRHRAMCGEFDCTHEESRAWARTDEGKRAIHSLFKK